MSVHHGFAFAFPITPNDTTGHGRTCEAIYVGGAGNITALVNGVAVLFTGVLAGTTIYVKNSRVNATGTTATALVGLAGA